ncbi:MAG: hypothetical protein PVI99_10040 [Anaerolineales bacterium]|jgi:hypothetical protein
MNRQEENEMMKLGNYIKELLKKLAYLDVQWGFSKTEKSKLRVVESPTMNKGVR